MAPTRATKAISRVDLCERLQARESVSNYLMMASYDADQAVFTLADLSVAVVFELQPLAASILSDVEMRTYSDAIGNALSRLPENALVQTMVVPAAQIEEDINAYLAAGGDEHPILARHERMVADQFRSSVTTPLFTFQFGEGGFKTKHYRVLLAIIIRPDAQVGGARASLIDFLRSLAWGPARRRDISRSPGEERYLAMKDRLYKAIQESARRFEATLRTNHVGVRRLLPEELIALVRMMLWPDAALHQRAAFDPYQQLSVQIPLADVALEFPTGSVLSDGWVYKTLTMACVPRSTVPGSTTIPQHALGLFTLLDYIGDGFITVMGHCKPLQDIRNYLEKRRTFVRGGFAMASKVDQLLSDCALTSFYIETDRRRIFDTCLTIIVRARSERAAQERAEKVRDKAADIGIECRIEQHFAPSLLFQALPLGCAPTIPEARRLWMLPDRSLTDLMPFFLLSRGTQRPALLLHNRLGEPFYFDPFDSPTAAHVVICGESGSGKSFFTNYLIYSVLRRRDAQVFAIDKGRSYATATAMLGEQGSYSNLGLTSKTCINAFAGTLAQSAAFLRQFIAHLASQVQRDRLNSDQLGLVDDCITAAFRKKQGRFSWLSYDEIQVRWPKGAWIDRLRKRFTILPLDAGQCLAVEQIRTRDAARSPEFDIYRQAILRGRRLSDQDGGNGGAEECYADVRSVDQATRQWLEVRGFRLEDIISGDGTILTAILYLTSTQERTLEIDGFRFEPVTDQRILEVARSEDLRELCDCGVRVVFPAAYVAESMVSIERQLRAEHAQATSQVIADIMRQRIAELDPLAYFAQCHGEICMQFEVYFSDFIRELSEHRDQVLARPIITRLAGYHGNGALAGFFDGETQFVLQGKKLCTFELQELSSAGEHLTAAVVGSLLQMLMLYCQGEHLANGGPRAYVKYIILDEFWALLAVPMVADLVITGLRTLRKFNAAIVCISQLVRDFAATEKGRVVLSASQHRILLRQPPDVVAELDDLLNWSAEQMGLMYTVVSAKGLFSEAMIDMPNRGISEVVRFVPTPYAYWIFTTSPEDVRQRDIMRNDFRAKGFPVEEALDLALCACAQRWPNGFAKGEPRV